MIKDHKCDEGTESCGQAIDDILYYHDGCWHVDSSGGEYSGVSISYCPFCGLKLC